MSMHEKQTWDVLLGPMELIATFLEFVVFTQKLDELLNPTRMPGSTTEVFSRWLVC